MKFTFPIRDILVVTNILVSDVPHTLEARYKGEILRVVSLPCLPSPLPSLPSSITPLLPPQELTRTNAAIATNCQAPFDSTKGGDAGGKWRAGKPIRVVRGYKGAKHSKYAPKEGCRWPAPAAHTAPYASAAPTRTPVPASTTSFPPGMTVSTR